MGIQNAHASHQFYKIRSLRTSINVTASRIATHCPARGNQAPPSLSLSLSRFVRVYEDKRAAVRSGIDPAGASLQRVWIDELGRTSGRVWILHKARRRVTAADTLLN